MPVSFTYRCLLTQMMHLLLKFSQDTDVSYHDCDSETILICS